MHYKLIDGQKIIGVISEDDFRRIQKKHHLIVYSDINNADPLYIDGNPWPESWKSFSSFDSEVYDYDIQQQQVLQGPVNRYSNCYQNYIFPADLFYSCAPSCTLKNALQGLSYKTHTLVSGSDGFTTMEAGPLDGLKGRLPMKLFIHNTEITELENVFQDLQICPFVGFSSYKYDSQHLSAQVSRGIKLPPDLFRYTPSITSLNETFRGIIVEAGIDMNMQ